MIRGKAFSAGVLAVLAAGILAAYGNGFDIGFYFDDGHGIADNPAIRSLANIPSFFVDPFTLTAMPTNADWRPVVVTTYALNYAISGVDPWSYHALNLVLHFLTAALVFVLVRDYVWWPAPERGAGGAARILAAAAAFFFAFAPVNSQAIDYRWARSAMLCTLLYLAAFWLLLHRRWLLACVVHWLALLTKTIAVTLPAVFLAYDYLYRDRQRHPGFIDWIADWRRLAGPVAALLVLDVAYIAIRTWMLPPWVHEHLHEKWVTPGIWFVSQWTALLHYVRVFIWPAGLSVDYDFAYNMSALTPRALGSLAGILAWLGAAWLVRDRLPHVAFATLWFFFTLAPESSFAPLAEVVNDHRPYIASTLGLSVLLAWVLDSAARAAGRQRVAVFAVATSILCVAGIAVARQRTSDWSSALTLWESTVRASPGNGRAWMNAGLAYMRLGRYAEARTHFERARELNPNYAYVYMNLSVLENAEGNADAALDWSTMAVEKGPQFSLSHYYHGRALEKLGRTAEAADEYRRTIELDPNSATAREALERVGKSNSQADSMAKALRLLDGEKNPDAAVVELRSLLAVNPEHYGAHWQLARALDAAGRRDEARAAWEAMLRLTIRWKNAADEKKVRDRLAAES